MLIQARVHIRGSGSCPVHRIRFMYFPIGSCIAYYLGMRTLHPAYRITDLATSLAFYGAIGFEQVGRVDLGDGVTLTMLKLPAMKWLRSNWCTGRPTDQWSSAAGSATSRCKSMTSAASR